MPVLPLPVGGSSLLGGDLPVSDASDVLAELPYEYQQPGDAPIRDAICEAFAEGFAEYQRLAETSAMQCDPLRATGSSLTSVGEEDGIPRADGEPDETYRDRLLASPEIVTPQAIYDTIVDILEHYTTALPCVFEPALDGWFASAGNLDSGFIGADPSYLERYYPDDEPVNGLVFDGSSPGGTWVGDGSPRMFVVRIPALEGSDDDIAFVFSGAYPVTSSEKNVFFVGDGTDPSGSESDESVSTSVYASRLSAQQVYDAIVAAVEAIKGQGVKWMLVVDPLLS